MQLTKHTDFALRTLMYVGSLPADKLATITEISDQFEIPRNHLMKVVNQLSRLGYLKTLRGPKGGIRLDVLADEINLATLIKDFEVRLDPINCDKPACPISGGCELKYALNLAQKAFFDVLRGYSLADLLKRPSTVSQLIISV
jgi:Rrf2 family nitric oxide-sensitive transcriptional repressor